MKRILIVDDEPFNILGLEQILKHLGPKNIHCYIDIAKNGFEALTLVKQAHI